MSVGKYVLRTFIYQQSAIELFIFYIYLYIVHV